MSVTGRILHAVHSLAARSGGPPAVVLGLTKSQASRGSSVRILATASDADTPSATVVVAPVGWGAVLGIRRHEAVRRAVREADIVHVHGIWDGVLLAAAAEAWRARIPYIITPHGMLHPWSLAQKAWKKRFALAAGVRQFLNRAAAIHVLNRDEAEAVRRLRLQPPIHTIPNGLDLTTCAEHQSDTLPQTVRQLNEKNRPFVLFLGRLHFKKGLDILAEAFARIARQHPSVDLVVAGPDDGARAGFEADMHRLKLADRVRLIGPVYGPAKSAILASATCFCLPSRQEGFSVAILEAMAAGIPVVVSETCYFPEVAEAGAGVVTALDAGAIAQGVHQVLADPAGGRRMGQAGRQLVAERYTWDRIAKQCDAMYQTARRALAGMP